MQDFTADHVTNQSSRALSSGGFEAFYTVQLAAFLKHQSHFDYHRFAERSARATHPLNSAEDLLAYNACYSADHFARFSELLAKLPGSQSAFAEPVRLTVFDYGCGQGLASLALLTHLQQRRVDLIINLVEPSKLALQAAVRYVRAYASKMRGSVVVRSYRCGLDQLPKELFVAAEERAVVHLFSNVLDMTHKGLFDLSRLTERMSRLLGKHLCLAVSPKFRDSAEGFETFKRLFADPNGQGMIVDEDQTQVSIESYRCLQKTTLTRNVAGRYLAFSRDIHCTQPGEVN